MHIFFPYVSASTPWNIFFVVGFSAFYILYSHRQHIETPLPTHFYQLIPVWKCERREKKNEKNKIPKEEKSLHKIWVLDFRFTFLRVQTFAISLFILLSSTILFRSFVWFVRFIVSRMLNEFFFILLPSLLLALREFLTLMSVHNSCIVYIWAISLFSYPN